MLIEIALDEVQPPVGLLTDVDRSVSSPFCGWIELLAVLADVVGSAAGEQHPRDPGAQLQ